MSTIVHHQVDVSVHPPPLRGWTWTDWMNNDVLRTRQRHRITRPPRGTLQWTARAIRRRSRKGRRGTNTGPKNLPTVPIPGPLQELGGRTEVHAGHGGRRDGHFTAEETQPSCPASCPIVDHRGKGGSVGCAMARPPETRCVNTMSTRPPSHLTTSDILDMAARQKRFIRKTQKGSFNERNCICAPPSPQ